jgi:hypothetical protein
MSRGGGAAVDEDVSTTNRPASVEKHISTDNWALLSEKGRIAIQKLIESDEEVGAQEHVYGGWPEAGVEDEGKISLADQVRLECLEMCAIYRKRTQTSSSVYFDLQYD